jgi:hypothetical protein
MASTKETVYKQNMILLKCSFNLTNSMSYPQCSIKQAWKCLIIRFMYDNRLIIGPLLNIVGVVMNNVNIIILVNGL